jgi:type II secretory pathway pseudopilin PulG
MIVLFIIALLTTLVTVSVVAVMKKARDNRRITDINSIASAADQYATEHKRKYPIFNVDSGNCNGSETTNFCWISAESTALNNALKNYLNPVPIDPLGPSQNRYVYAFNKAGTKCAIVANVSERGRSICNIPEVGSITGLPDAVQFYIAEKGGDRPCYYVAR